MSSQSRKSPLSRRGRSSGVEADSFARPNASGEGFVARAIAQFRDALVGPLKPFPLAHVANGVSTGVYYGNASEGPAVRDAQPALAVPGMAPATLQNAHAFLTMLPTLLPMPETRRHGHGQVALEWHGDSSRRFSVVIGPEGMLIYAARLGSRGRLDGAEPIGKEISPIVMHAINQLRD